VLNSCPEDTKVSVVGVFAHTTMSLGSSLAPWPTEFIVISTTIAGGLEGAGEFGSGGLAAAPPGGTGGERGESKPC
jgi:hypothetical protein